MVTPAAAEALWLSASHFVPGVVTAATASLPRWCSLGAGLTSWLLFVIYIGIAASALPIKQRRMISTVVPAYTMFRKAFLLIARNIRTLKRLVPPKQLA